MVRENDAMNRTSHTIGRFGITITEKQPGDHYWDSRSQSWRVVGQDFHKGTGGELNKPSRNIDAKSA